MVIYLDVLLALNWLIDFLLLSAAAKLLRLPERRVRLVLGAGAGGLSSLLILLPEPPLPLSFVIKLAVAAAVIRIAFKWQGIRLYIKELAAFLICSAVFAGLAYALWFVAAPAGFTVVQGVVYYNVSPLMLTLLTVLSYLALTLYDRLTRRRMAEGQEYRLVMEVGSRRTALRALYDTGHQVTELFSGSPVIIARLPSLEPGLPAALFQVLERVLAAEDSGGGTVPDKAADAAVRTRLRMIPVQTVGGTGLLPAFRPERLRLEKPAGRTADITGAYVAVSRVLGRGEYEAIVGTDLVSMLEGKRLSWERV